jgi:2-isopropylmalate synthase
MDYAMETLMAAFGRGCRFSGALRHQRRHAASRSGMPLPRIGSKSRLKAGGSRTKTEAGHSHPQRLRLAAANSIAAINCGAVMVHGTVNGYGERCGNADLTTIIPILSVKMNRLCISPWKS